MKRSFLAIALLACASIACAFYGALASPIVTAYRAVKGFVLDAFEAMATESATPLKPMVQQVQAKAFVRRIEKRERPVVTGAWRLCPSI